MTPTDFAETIKTYRDQLALTQERAAVLCSVSPRTWVNWERSLLQGRIPSEMTMRGVIETLREKLHATMEKTK